MRAANFMVYRSKSDLKILRNGELLAASQSKVKNWKEAERNCIYISLSLSLLDTFIRGLSNWLVVYALVVESSCLFLSLRS